MKKLISLLALAAIAFTGCGKQNTRGSSSDSGAASSTDNTTASNATMSTSNATASTGTLPPVDLPGGTAASSSTRASTSESNFSLATPSDSWNELSTYTYERRGEFNSSLNAMSAKVDAEIATLKSKTTSGGNADNKQEALKEVQEAKADFDGKAAALGRASQQQWNEARDEVAQSWQRLQSALQRARSAG